MDINELITEKEFYINLIKEARKNIAMTKQQKALAKAPLWDEATGTVDQKKDFIKSRVAEYDLDIAVEESNVEYAYNMLEIINDKMLVLDE